ncbi:hypothetical protein AXG93_773s1700 [Marchantia polymorpha subsp. ruderalis]|uniref:Uncharacterized protein n=1 Tax=Marchantia polymorpha subsp. ruderalis TaxID=1480154 RepID=A0A176W9Y7_MARPO|nr:hypothetical protein AXG93_773s1700 [Marchantia polymorpha subsp. ruderalis]
MDVVLNGNDARKSSRRQTQGRSGGQEIKQAGRCVGMMRASGYRKKSVESIRLEKEEHGNTRESGILHLLIKARQGKMTERRGELREKEEEGEMGEREGEVWDEDEEAVAVLTSLLDSSFACPGVREGRGKPDSQACPCVYAQDQLDHYHLTLSLPMCSCIAHNSTLHKLSLQQRGSCIHARSSASAQEQLGLSTDRRDCSADFVPQHKQKQSRREGGKYERRQAGRQEGRKASGSQVVDKSFNLDD